MCKFLNVAVNKCVKCELMFCTFISCNAQEFRGHDLRYHGHATFKKLRVQTVSRNMHVLFEIRSFNCFGAIGISFYAKTGLIDLSAACAQIDASSSDDKKYLCHSLCSVGALGDKYNDVWYIRIIVFINNRVIARLFQQRIYTTKKMRSTNLHVWRATLPCKNANVTKKSEVINRCNLSRQFFSMRLKLNEHFKQHLFKPLLTVHLASSNLVAQNIHLSRVGKLVCMQPYTDIL